MPRIQQLDALVVNKIAAGEVIERPASIIKELLENSLDALATRVEVDVAQGGAELIRVLDDGEGIHPDDLLLAVTSHATSKLRTDEDLFRVHTFGFRGEALASIASVSRLGLRSRQADSETGSEIEAAFGRVGPVESCGCAAGTLVEVRQLFANTPVRRKFLRSVSTEFAHVSEQFVRIALAHPRLHAVLRHNGRVVYELPAAAQLADRLRLFFGPELVEKLLWVESENDQVRLWGYVGYPSESRSTRKGQYLFLNGRWIQDRSLQHALAEAYRGLLMVGRHPVAFLFVEMPPEMVDVNVHPTKQEVRFRDGQALYRQMLSTLRSRFLSSNLESFMKIPGMPTPQVDPARRSAVQAEFAEWAKQELEAWDPSQPPKIQIEDLEADIAATDSEEAMERGVAVEAPAFLPSAAFSGMFAKGEPTGGGGGAAEGGPDWGASSTWPTEPAAGLHDRMDRGEMGRLQRRPAGSGSCRCSIVTWWPRRTRV